MRRICLPRPIYVANTHMQVYRYLSSSLTCTENKTSPVLHDLLSRAVCLAISILLTEYSSSILSKTDVGTHSAHSMVLELKIPSGNRKPSTGKYPKR